MPQEVVVQHVYPDPEDWVRVKLTKNSKGYGWEISVGGKDGEEALAQLREVEGKVWEEFGKESEE